MRRLVATLVTGTTLLAACSTSTEPSDEMQVSESLAAATPAPSPTTATAPAGAVLPAPGPVDALAADERTRTLAVASGQTLHLHNLDQPDAPSRTVTLPGTADSITVTHNGLLVTVSQAHQVLRVTLPDASTSAITVDGTPGSATQVGDRTLVAVRDRKAVEVRTGDQVQRTIAGSLFSADQVLDTGNGTVVLDRLRTALFELDLNGGTVGAGVRAGMGATNATTDKYGRVLVVDTRGGALLAFTTGPVMLKQRYPVPGAPYGIAYDPHRDLAWVTLTERNEVVGYDVAGGEPQERYRFPTVVQPNSVTVDPAAGRVYVASATGGGIQVMQP